MEKAKDYRYMARFLREATPIMGFGYSELIEGAEHILQQHKGVENSWVDLLLKNETMTPFDAFPEPSEILKSSLSGDFMGKFHSKMSCGTMTARAGTLPSFPCVYCADGSQFFQAAEVIHGQREFLASSSDLSLCCLYPDLGTGGPVEMDETVSNFLELLI